MAGKGSFKERGLRPLSDSLPLSNKLNKGYEPGTLFTELSRDMVYSIRYRQEVRAYALEGDLSDGTAGRNGR